MSQERSYLDHNATSPLRPEARAAMLEAMELIGNPSSVHAEGRAAKSLMERARRQVASLVGANPEQVVFTSGGTEANAHALEPYNYQSMVFDEPYEVSGLQFSGPWHTHMCAVSRIEHDSVKALGRFAENKCVWLACGTDGRVDAVQAGKDIQEALAGDSANADGGEQLFLASLMAANNETGAIQPTENLAQIIHALGGEFHTDAVQVAGKTQFHFNDHACEFASVSAHKFGGPKGCGAYCTKDVDAVLDAPLLTGGGQEKGMRAGTENLIGIAGFGAAAEAAERDLDAFARLVDWRDELESAVAQQTSDAVVIARSSPRLPNTSCIALPGVSAETLVMALDLEGVAVSAGSACSSGKVTRSHVLEAMGLPDELSGSAIRISLGWNSSKKDVDHFMKAWTTVTNRFARDMTAS